MKKENIKHLLEKHIIILSKKGNSKIKGGGYTATDDLAKWRK